MNRGIARALILLTIAGAAQAAHAEEGHLFIVTNHESGDYLIRGNISEDEMATILPEAQAIRKTGWDSIDADPSPGWGAISCVRKPDMVWFDYSTGHDSEAYAVEIANAGAQKHAAEHGGTYVPNCGLTWNNDGGRIWIDGKARDPAE
jgi:hypothetical protein